MPKPAAWKCLCSERAPAGRALGRAVRKRAANAQLKMKKAGRVPAFFMGVAPACAWRSTQCHMAGALDEFDFVAIGVGYKGNDGFAAFDRPWLTGHGAARFADAIAGGGHIGHTDGDVSIGCADVQQFSF